MTKSLSLRNGLLLVVVALALAGCQTAKPYDYTNFRAHPPRSIVVIPPLNESTDVAGGYSYLSTVTRPLAELGYYVFPVAVVDQFLKENGMPTAGEMNQVPVNKIGEIMGADAVLFLDLKQYGSKYVVINSVTTVEVTAKLVDTHTGTLLWEGRGFAQQSASSSGNPVADAIAALVSQAVNKTVDSAHGVSQLANSNLFLPEGTGLPYGPYNLKYDRGR